MAPEGANQPPDGSAGARAGPSEHPRSTPAEDHMDLDEDNPTSNNQNDANQGSPPQPRRGTWQDAINIPHRDLRYPNSTLPPLGKIIDASQRRYTPPPPTAGDEEEDDDDETGLAEEFEGNLHEINPDEDDDDDFVTRADVRGLHRSIREDLNAAFNRIVDEMDRRQKPETPEATPPVVSGHKRSTNPSRRGKPRNERLRSVRDHLLRLVGVGKLFVPSVTQGEVAAFEALWNATDGNPPHACCTIETFRIDVLGKPRDPWNRSAASVFYKSYVPEANRSAKMLKEVTADFHNRVKTVIAEYKKRSDEGARRIAQRDARRKRRKYDLFHRRLMVAQTVPEFHQHVDILERLTVAGMSSDESDNERIVAYPTLAQQEPSYEITKPAWRNQRLFAWLHVFDTFHIANRRRIGASAGEWPHARQVNMRNPKISSSTRYIPDLPIDAYDVAWLNTRHDLELMVRPAEEIYNFTHTDAVHAVG